MAGTTSSIISQLISSIQSLFNFRPASSSLPASSSSSALAAAGTTAQVNLFQENFMDDLRRLERMLRRVQAVLRDAEMREIHDQTIQLWLSELREVAYDAEDALDEYNYQVLKTQVEGMAAAEAEPSLKRKREDDDDDPEGYQVCLSISKAIRKIVDKFDEIAKDREALQLREEDGFNRLTPRKRPVSSSLLVHDSVVFGREDDKKRIIQLLMSDSEEECNSNISVIPVVGMGGVGKTTLIQLVYKDPKVSAHFSPKVWVCVSEEFDVVRVTKEILKSVGLDDTNNLNDLQCVLKKALQEKRFLLVLDDVWNERPDLWESLRAPFSGVGKGKVIITTRSMSVARIMQTVPPHELGCLNEEKSWLLFKRHAFCGWEPDEQLDFANIGRRISMKCGGLPLALKALGEVLRNEVDEQTWLDVLNNDLWELEKTNKLILPALRISYEHLPTHLKPCFVYASLFPKDFSFYKPELIGLWMAQGYIQPEGKRLLEDIASEYFDELQRRLLFDPIPTIHHDYQIEFVLHDMVHDLARSISENKIYSMLDFKQLKSIPKDAKHISLRLTKIPDLEDDMATVFFMFDALRTFRLEIWHDTFKHDYEGYILGKQVKDLFPRFSFLRALKIDAPQFTINLQFVSWISKQKHLRFLSIQVQSMQMVDDFFTSLYNLHTLELKSCYLSMLPHGMGKLINLRHLVLTCSVEMLSESIFQLQNLLTLNIRGNYKLRELPHCLSKLINLRHLVLPFGCDIPRGIVNLTNLQTFNQANVFQPSKIGWLGHLVNLRGKLEISGLRNVLSYEDAMSANLQSKPHIKSLSLFWETYGCTHSKDVMQSYSGVDECTMREEAVLGGLHPHTQLEDLWIENYGGNKFPSWFGNPSFSKLTTIILRDIWNIEECKFLPLSRLPSLKYLRVDNIKGIKIMGDDFWCYPHPDGHENNSTTNGFNEMHVGFPSLETLFFESMPEWEEWRMQNGDFPNLKVLRIQFCPKLSLLPTLPSRLEEFLLWSCGSLRNLALYDSSESPSSLKKLNIWKCPQLESDLVELEIRGCPSLKSVNII